MSAFNAAIRAHFNDHIAAYCDAIETTITATETDPAVIRGARIALDGLRRIVGAPIPNRNAITVIDQPATLPARTQLHVESVYPDRHYRVR